MIFLNFKFNNENTKFNQLNNFIKSNIFNGVLKFNDKLPSTRELSQIIKASRNTILKVYNNLEDEGFVEKRKNVGVFVKYKNNLNSTLYKNIIGWNNYFSDYMKISNSEDIIKSELKCKKNMISFKSIAPNEKLFNMESLKRAFLDLVSFEGAKIINYGYAKGYIHLIEWLKNYMSKKGVNVENRDILITNGFTEGFDIIIESLTKENDTILIEEPTHNTVIKILKAHKLNIKTIKIDNNGIDIEKMEKIIYKIRPKFVFLTPSYQNPTGTVIEPEKRLLIYQILKRYNIPIIEDGFNEELLYNSSHIPPVSSYSSSNDIIYLGSFSKILYPGIRIGWILADKFLIDKIESVKRLRNIHTSFLDQGILYYYLKNEDFDKYIRKSRRYYSEKYKLVIKMVNKYINYEYVSGEGGLFIYVKLKNYISSKLLLEECYKSGVIFMPGYVFNVDNKEDSSFRLGFSRVSDEEIKYGIKIIGQVIKKLENKN
jgi:DNA-binding transcriptional MocR family regulator